MAQSLVQRVLASAPLIGLMSAAPVPHAVLRGVLSHDNRLENRRDSWQRLRAEAEQARYDAVRSLTEAYAADGFVLDVGCSQGILQEGLRYGRYLGIDSFPEAIALAGERADERTAFRCADATTFTPPSAPDVVVLNEVLYYLPDPVGVARRYAALLAPDGAVVVSLFAHAWSNRRLLRRIGTILEPAERQTVHAGQLAWTIAAFRSAGHR